MGPFIILEKHVSSIPSFARVASFSSSPCHPCELGDGKEMKQQKKKKTIILLCCTKFPTNQHLIVFSFTLVEDTYKK